MITRIGIVIISLSVTTSISIPVKETPALILSPYIEQNRLAEARNASLVNSTLFLNIKSHAGFLTVDKKHDSNLYFWYFPVADKPVNETPWIIWLQGGPGATSLAGLFDEIGPFEYRAGELRPRQWSWTANYSVLFIDNPIGAGFSFTNNKESFVKDMEACSSHLYSALQQFLTIFPELRTAPLFIAGESYAGRYVPAFGYKILEEKPAGNVSLNLKGLIMGNPIIDRIDAANISSIYYHWGLLDAQGLLATKPLQDQYSKAIMDNNVALAWKLRDQLLDLIYQITHQPSHFNLLENGSGNLNEFEGYIARLDVREAMHVGSIQFTFNNGSVDRALMNDFLGPVRPKLEKLLEHYKIMVYCGQLDLTAPCELGAESRRKYWHWSQRANFFKAPRLPWTYNGTLAGYVKEGGGLTEVLVRGAGHLVPLDAPAAALALLSHFVSNTSLSTASGFENNSEYNPEYIDNPEYPGTTEHVIIQPAQKTNAPLIASVVVNVLLGIFLIGGVVIYFRYKRRSEAFFYSTVEDSISDGILTMTPKSPKGDGAEDLKKRESEQVPKPKRSRTYLANIIKPTNTYEKFDARGSELSFIKQGGGLTEVLVRGSGHLVPRDAPAQAKQLITSFIDNQNLTISTSYTSKPEYTPEMAERKQSFFKTELEESGPDGLLALSIIINVILAFSLVFALAYYLKWKWQKEEYSNSRVYYSPLSITE